MYGFAEWNKRLIINGSSISLLTLRKSVLIRFHEIESITQRVNEGHGMSTSIYYVHGPACRVAFSTQMRHSRQALDSILSERPDLRIQPHRRWGSAPEERQLKLRLVLGSSIGVALFGGWWIVHAFLQNQALSDHGAATSARIRWVFAKQVKFDYTVNGRSYYGEVEAPLEESEKLTSGDALPIRYLPEDPSVYRASIDAGDAASSWGSEILSTLVTFPVIAFIAWVAGRLIKRWTG
jgi:hypothetical protein